MLAQVAPLGGACLLEVLTVLAKALTLIASLGEPYIPEVPKVGDKLEQDCLKG